MRFFLFFLISTLGFSQEVELKFPLTLGGEFVGKAAIKNGRVKKKGSKYFAKNLIVNVEDITTDNSLRDSHVHKKLKFKKYPQIKILKAMGKKGKGVALVEIRGVKKKLPFKFKDKGMKVKFDFDIALSDFKIDRKKEGFVYLGVGIKENIKVSGFLMKRSSKRNIASE